MSKTAKTLLIMSLVSVALAVVLHLMPRHYPESTQQQYWNYSN